jgi:hypothetical protein
MVNVNVNVLLQKLYREVKEMKKEIREIKSMRSIEVVMPNAAERAAIKGLKHKMKSKKNFVGI